MTNTLIKTLILLPFIIVLSCNKISVKPGEKTLTIKSHDVYVDSLSGDFNFDGKNDMIKIKKERDTSLVFLLFDNNFKKPTLVSENAIYSVGNLTPGGVNFLTMSFNEGVIKINQEYGSARPDGWFTAYISYKNKQYIVDSISNSFKDLKENQEKINIKRNSIIINKPLSKVSLVGEFEKL